MDGRTRNLMGQPAGVLILHWFELGSAAGVADLPLLVDYATSVASDPGIEIVMIAINSTREVVASWAREHGLPTEQLYVDAEGKTAGLIGVRRIPETLIYDSQGHLAHQARGPMDWSAPEVRAAIAGFKEGGGHTH